MASCVFVIEMCGLNQDIINTRMGEKIIAYGQWQSRIDTQETVGTKMSSPDDFIVRSASGRCGVVSGLSEETVAMLFALFSRNPKNVTDTLASMVNDGSFGERSERNTGEKIRKFHERVTIGYGHKSVADHAVVHCFVEGGSAVSERSFTSARLAAFTSKSTRYVDFRTSDLVIPEEISDAGLAQELEDHARILIKDYQAIADIAVEAIRSAYPKSDRWTQTGWENATSKRGLDAVRDLLPACIATSYAISASATSIREILDKRETSGNVEINGLAREIRQVVSAEIPSLMSEARTILTNVVLPAAPVYDGRSVIPSNVRVVSTPDWRSISELLGAQPNELTQRWMGQRGHHMPPDRSAELPEYVISVVMPFAIARDLGRHRMMTQLWSDPQPWAPFGRDPVMSDEKLAESVPHVGLLSVSHSQALDRARARMLKMQNRLPMSVASYACPLATMVRGVWKVNLRELVHMVGLRTTPQGHPAYRKFVQTMVKAIKSADPIGGSALESVTNFTDVLVGRPN